MAVNTVKLVVVDGNVIKETVDLRSSKKGSPTKVKALKGGKFILAESDTGFAPENVTTHRVGHDLHISLEGTGYDDAELVIEGYYDNDGTLIGLGEDGNYYQYVPTDAESDHFVAALADGATSPQVLGAERLTGLGAFVAGPAFSLLGLGLAALGALGIIGAAVAIGRGDDGSIGGGHDGGQNPGDGHLRPSIGEATDNVGDKTGALHSGDVTDDTAPVFTGTGKPGEQINIIDNGKIIGSTIVGDDGSWTFKPTTPLPDGNHTIIVQPADGGDPSDGFDLIVDTTAPDKVVIDGVDDDFGERMGPVANHGFTDDNTPTLHGHAEAGSTVTIYGNDQMLGTAVADADGNWRFTPTELPDGSYNFTARATDAAGNIGLPSDPYEVIIDTVAPGKPGLGDEGNSNIGDILDDYGPIKGSIDNPGLTDDDTPTLIGKGEPGDTVTIIDNGEVIGTAPVDKDGNWNFTPDPLGDGKHDFTIIVTDPAGNASDESDPWTVVIDTEKPDKPVITSVIDDQGDVTGPINPNGTTDDAQPEIKGTAEADSTVIIKDNGVVIGSTTADKDGNWSFTPTLPLLNGGHELTVEAMDPAGNISDPSDPFNFDLLTGGVPTAPAITGVLDDQGDITGNVAPNGITDDRQPEIHGTAQIGSTVSVYLDGTLLGTAPVNAQGQWSFQVTTDLPDGLHNFTAKATSAAGNVSAETGDYPITVDGTAPGAIVDPTLTDDIGAVTGPINTGDTTDDANPTFTGKGEPGSTVIIKDNGAVIGTAPVDSNGDWTFTPATPLQDGDHSFIAEPVDQAGNHGPETAPIDFTVDTSGVVISITSVVDNFGAVTGPISLNGVTDDTTPTLNGKATKGAIVTVYDTDGHVLGTTTASANTGLWSFTPTSELGEGAHHLTATATTDAAGESAPVAFDLTIDTTAPAAPSITDVHDDVGTIQGTVADNGFTDDTTPTLTGKGEAGSTVSIRDNGNVIGMALVDSNGDWSFTPGTDLNKGSHAFTVVATDPAGNVSAESAPWTVTVDFTAPDQPVIGDILDDFGPVTGSIDNPGLTDDDTPTLVGKGEPGDTVTIIKDGEVIGTAPVDSNGDWTFTPDPLDDGKHDFTIIVTDPAGNASDESDPWTVTIDTEKPDKPVITSVIDDQGDVTGPINPNGVTDDAQPDITGTAEANSIVIIKDNDQIIGSAQVDENGNWSFTPTLPLDIGGHALTVEAMDPAGNISDPSDPFNFDLLTGGVPPAPAITGVLDDQGDITGNVSPNGITDDRQPEIHGTAQSGSIVSVYSDGTLLGTAPVNAQGQWSFQVTTDLPDGLHNFTAKATSGAGNVSPETGDYPITVDGTAPGAIVNPTLTDDIGAVTGPINTGDTTDDANPTFTGKGEPGSTVIIKDNGVEIGTAPVDSNGDWTFTPATPLEEGDHSFTATPVDQAGNHGPETTPIDFTVDTSGVVISITSVVDDFGTVTGPISLNGVTDDTTPTLNGKATLGALVTVYDTDGRVLGTTTADASTGLWSITPTIALGEGAHHLTATATTDAAGESAPVAFDLTIDTTAPAVPSITDVHDDVGAIQGTVADNGFTDDTTPTLKGKGEAGSTVSIRDNGNVIGTALVDSNGDWSFTPATPLNPVEHVFTVIDTDPAGNVSAESAPWTVTIDTTAPNAPVITGALDDVGAIRGNVVSGGVTDDRQLLLSGTGEAGTTVTVKDGATVLGTALVGIGGLWSLQLTSDLGTGAHNFTATQADLAGNISAQSNTYQVTVDFTAPAAPAITGVLDDVGAVTGNIANNGATDDRRPLLSGTGEAGSTVTVKDGTTVLGTALVNSTGKWSLQVASDLAYAQHTFTATQVDKAGNGSPVSAAYNIGIAQSYVWDFNNGTLQGWTATGLYASKNQLDILNGQVTSGTNGTASDNWSGGVMYIDISVVAGQKYSLEFDASGRSPTGVQSALGMTIGGTTVIAAHTLINGVSQHLSGTYTATTTGTVRLQMFNSQPFGETNDFFADNIKLNPVGAAAKAMLGTEEADTDSSVMSDSHVFALADTGDLTENGVTVHGSDGIDTLQLTGANQVLDLSALNNKISSVEVIDLTGSGNNTLKISLGDVLQQGGADLFINDGKTQMMVKGNAGDHVELSDLMPDGGDLGDWSKEAGSVTVGGVAYDVYQHAGAAAELLVQQGVTLDLNNHQ